jgi:hypothetical protein
LARNEEIKGGIKNQTDPTTQNQNKLWSGARGRHK